MCEMEFASVRKDSSANWSEKGGEAGSEELSSTLRARRRVLAPEGFDCLRAFAETSCQPTIGSEQKKSLPQSHSPRRQLVVPTRVRRTTRHRHTKFRPAKATRCKTQKAEDNRSRSTRPSS